LPQKGLLLAFNPTDREITTTLTLPLAYTGLSETARIREGEGKPAAYRLDRDYRIELPVRVASRGFSWFVVE